MLARGPFGECVNSQRLPKYSSGKNISNRCQREFFSLPPREEFNICRATGGSCDRSLTNVRAVLNSNKSSSLLPLRSTEKGARIAEAINCAVVFDPFDRLEESAIDGERPSWHTINVAMESWDFKLCRRFYRHSARLFIFISTFLQSRRKKKQLKSENVPEHRSVWFCYALG